MVNKVVDKLKKHADENIATAREEAPNFETVIWYKDAGLRKLYFYAFVLCIASATTGYDGYVTSLLRHSPRSWETLLNALS